VADRKITDLTALTTPASADVLPIVDVSEAAAADKNKKITVGELFKGVPDGTAAAPAIAFESDDGNGIFLSTTDTVAIATNGSSRMTVSTTAVTSTLPVIVPDGTAAAPSVAFTGSGTDTGIYSPGVDQVAVATNGAGRLFVDANGNVGIGTASPDYKLDVSGSGTQVIRVLTTDTSGFAVGGYRAEYLGGGGGTNTSVDLRAGDSYSYLVTTTNHPILFGTNATERARIDSSGRLLVGTSSALTNVLIKGDLGSSAATTPQEQFALATNSYNAGLSVTNYSASGYGGVLSLNSSGSNTLGTNALVGNTIAVGTISFNGNDGTNFVPCAEIKAAVDGTPG
jgi:hypothetical protein